MQILNKIEQALSKLLDQPLAGTLADLEALAKAAPTNPGPHLAMAMVSAIGRHDAKLPATYLQQARARLAGADMNDPEMKFAAALFQVVSAEFRLLALGRPVRGTAAGQLAERARAEKQSRSAIKDMGAVVGQLGGSDLAETVHAALETLARSTPANSQVFQHGLAALGKLRAAGKLQSLAGFFQIYAHRRTRRYDDALQVGHDLEARHPNSAMVKQLLGTCYQRKGDLARSEKMYRQAMTLAPDNPSVLLGAAHVEAALGNVDSAHDLADKAAVADTSDRLDPYIKDLRSDLAVRGTLGDRNP